MGLGGEPVYARGNRILVYCCSENAPVWIDTGDAIGKMHETQP